MGLAEAFCLVPATSFGCSGVECGRVLREDRGAPSGWFAAIPASRDGGVHSSKTKLGGRLAGSSEHELGSDWRRGAMFPPSWRSAGCDWRGPWTSARHGSRSAGGRSPYGDILGRQGYREVTNIPSLEKARDVYRMLVDAFRVHFGEAKRTLGNAEYVT